MTKKINTRKLLAELTGQKSTLNIPRIFIKLVDGDIITAMFLSQLMYWQERTTNEGGWVIKSYDDWEEELFLSAYQIRKAIKLLKKLEIGVDTKTARSKYHDYAPTIHYKLNIQTMIDRFELEYSQSVIIDNEIFDNEKISHSDSEKISVSYNTETTSKTIIPPASVPDAKKEPSSTIAQKNVSRKSKRAELGKPWYEDNGSSAQPVTPGLLEDHNLNPTDANLLDVPPGNAVNVAAQKQVQFGKTYIRPEFPIESDEDTPPTPDVTINWDGDYPTGYPPRTGRNAPGKAESDVVEDVLLGTSTLCAWPTIKLDPTILTKEHWSALGRGLFYVVGNRRHHVWFVQGGIVRCGEMLADTGVLKRMSTKGHYKLTDDGHTWVNANIPGEWRKAGFDKQKERATKKQEAAKTKETRQLTPPQPKGRKKVAPNIEPIFNRFVKHWGKPATKTEHNTFVSTAWEFHNANGTIDEIDAIWVMKIENDWKAGTVRLCVTKLGKLRDDRAKLKTAIKTAQAQVIEVDDSPLDIGTPAYKIEGNE